MSQRIYWNVTEDILRTHWNVKYIMEVMRIYLIFLIIMPLFGSMAETPRLTECGKNTLY
jgi:hypothetical protein